MRREERLASRLLATFEAYKQREASRMLHFYSERLLGLEDGLLEARHQLLQTQVRSAAFTCLSANGLRVLLLTRVHKFS